MHAYMWKGKRKGERERVGANKYSCDTGHILVVCHYFIYSYFSIHLHIVLSHTFGRKTRINSWHAHRGKESCTYATRFCCCCSCFISFSRSPSSLLLSPSIARSFFSPLYIFLFNFLTCLNTEVNKHYFLICTFANARTHRVCAFLSLSLPLEK